MKKAAVLIATVILSVFCSVSVFAAGNDLSEKKTIGVFAKSVYTLPDGCYGTEEDDNGNLIAELPDGVKVTAASNSLSSSLRMVIVPITEQHEQAYRWISDCTTGFGSDLLFYDIYFVDKYGNRVDVNMPIDVSVALMNGYATLKAAEISADGNVLQLASKSGGNKITFGIVKGGYYAVASTKTDRPVSPKTGDNGIMDLYNVMLFVSGAAIAEAAIYAVKKRYSEKL